MTTMKDAYHELWGGSPKHDAVDEMFASGWNAVIEATGGTDHLAQVTETGWTIQHPITDRLEGDLFGCPFNELVHIAGEQGDLKPGRYKLWRDEHLLLWEEIE
jgi:hypothetical protein